MKGFIFRQGETPETGLLSAFRQKHRPDQPGFIECYDSIELAKSKAPPLSRYLVIADGDVMFQHSVLGGMALMLRINKTQAEDWG